MHAADVCVVQLLVAQSADTSAEVSVVSVGAKFMPTRVTLAVTEANEGARALYEGARMTEAARYHYRLKRP